MIGTIELILNQTLFFWLSFSVEEEGEELRAY